MTLTRLVGTIGHLCLMVVGGMIGSLMMRSAMVSAQPDVELATGQTAEQVGKGLIQQTLDLERSVARIGSVVAFSGDWPPVIDRKPDGAIKTQMRVEDCDWRVCDRQLMSPQSFPELFRTIGNRYGSESGEFRLPNYQGYFLRSVGGKNAEKPTDAVNKEGWNKEVGHKQHFATSLPTGTTPFSTAMDGRHQHDGKDARSGNACNRLLRFDGNRTITHTTPRDNDPGVAAEEPNLKNSASLGPGLHSHVVNVGGDVETRPQNFAVYWLIKVR